MLLEARVTIKPRVWASSKQQTRGLTPYSQQAVGLRSIFYTHTNTCINELPGQSLVTLRSAVYFAVCCNLIAGAQAYTLKLRSFSTVWQGADRHHLLLCMQFNSQWLTNYISVTDCNHCPTVYA